MDQSSSGLGSDVQSAEAPGQLSSLEDSKMASLKGAASSPSTPCDTAADEGLSLTQESGDGHVDTSPTIEPQLTASGEGISVGCNA